MPPNKQEPSMLTDEALETALRRAFSLGKTYWDQCESQSYSDNRKSDETLNKFVALCKETHALRLAGLSAQAVPVAWMCKGYPQVVNAEWKAEAMEELARGDTTRAFAADFNIPLYLAHPAPQDPAEPSALVAIGRALRHLRTTSYHQDKAELFALLEPFDEQARAALRTQAPQEPAEPSVGDVMKSIADGFKRHGYRQGTKECVAFNRGITYERERAALRTQAGKETG